jgi:hypothetical protein
MADRPTTSLGNIEVEKRYTFSTLYPERSRNRPILDAPQYPSSKNYSFENPPPRTIIRPEIEPAAEPGFYVVPRSVSARELYQDLFDDLPVSALSKFSALNPGLADGFKAGSIVVLADPKSTSCTYAEAQLMQAAHQVKAALAPLTAEEADFMHRHSAEIITFTGQTSTWLGVSAVVVEKHLSTMAATLKSIEELHQKSFKQHGHLNSPEFFARRKELIHQLDAQLLKSARLRSLTTMDNHRKLKNALGISSRSLVHHWKEIGAPGQVPGYANHVSAVSKAAKYMQTGGYIGIGIGGVSGWLAIQEVCRGKDAEACRKVRFTEGGKFLGSSISGYVAGELAFAASGTVCAALGVSTGVGGIVCAAALVGVGVWAGASAGGTGGERMGEAIYEGLRP